MTNAGEEGSDTSRENVETKRVKIGRVIGNSKTPASDTVVHEVEVSLVINGNSHTRLCCLPTHLDELATGYALSEGIVPGSMEITEGMIRISGVKPDDNGPERITSQYKISAEDVKRYASALDQYGSLFKKTGGTHVVGIFGEGDPIFVEDISRHCAIDKVIGSATRNKLDLHMSTLVTSCRQTASAIRKAIRAQIPVVVSISAATDLAIQEAEDYGVTLIGFCRDRQFNIYSHDWRITFSR